MALHDRVGRRVSRRRYPSSSACQCCYFRAHYIFANLHLHGVYMRICACMLEFLFDINTSSQLVLFEQSSAFSKVSPIPGRLREG